MLQVALVLVPTSLAAQMAGLRTERLATNVYAMVRTTRVGDPSDANTLVIVNDADVIVVDGNITPRSTRAVIAEIRKLTRKPVRYVIITHWHSDHYTGNIEYRRAWPGVEFVAHRNTRDDILTNDVPGFRRLVTEEYPNEIKRLQAVLARGVTASGTALTAEERTRTTSGIAAMRYFIEEVSTFDLIPPTLTFDDSLVLHREDRAIVGCYLGAGNTRGDVVVHLPRERVLATGDLVVSPVRFAFGPFPFAWVATLDRLRQIPAEVILPGHREPMRAWNYVDQLHDLLCATTQRVVAAGGRSVPLDTLLARVSLEDLSPRFAGGVEWIPRVMRGTYIRPAIGGAYGELDATPVPTVPATCQTSSR